MIIIQVQNNSYKRINKQKYSMFMTIISMYYTHNIRT